MTGEEAVLLILIISAAAALILVGVIFVAYATYAIIFKRKRRDHDPYHGLDKPGFSEHSEKFGRMIERIRGEEYESVSITARDGTKLSARLYYRHTGAPIHLICHGYKSSPLRDGSGGGGEALDLGHNLLLISQRAHGESEGKVISFGINERFDIVDWTEYLTKRYGDECEIILIGTSMGAASVIMAREVGLPKTVKCVIADCPYSTPKGAILASAKKMGYPPRLIYPFIRLGARIFGGFNLEAASPIRAITHPEGAPILIAHGEADSIVPVEMARELMRTAEAAGTPCSLKIFPGAEHCTSFVVDYGGYIAWRNEHLKKYLRSFD